MSRYERVRVVSSRPFTVLLEIQAESARFLTGIEVGRDGLPVSGRGFDQRTHVIEKALIAKRTAMTMNLHYGELEPSRSWGREE